MTLSRWRHIENPIDNSVLERLIELCSVKLKDFSVSEMGSLKDIVLTGIVNLTIQVID